MTASVTKSHLIESIRKVLVPVLERQRAGYNTEDAARSDTELVDLCSGLIRDLESMFHQTGDREIWLHVDDLTVKNPFPGFLSVDTVASEEVSSFLYGRAEKYFNQCNIRTRELDWFYLDFVIAVGFRVLVKRYEDTDLKTAYPGISKAIDESDGRNIWVCLKGILINYILKAALKNLILFGSAIFLFFVASEGNTWAGLLGGSLILWKLYRWNSQWRLFFKLKKVSAGRLSQFNALYQTLSDGFVRWGLLEHDMTRLRELSVDFPRVLDTAITATKFTQVPSR
jgi:hypothetical protein